MIASDTHNLGEAHHLCGALSTRTVVPPRAFALRAAWRSSGKGVRPLPSWAVRAGSGKPRGSEGAPAAGLQLRWGARLRASAAEALEALAEAWWQLGDVKLAAAAMQAAFDAGRPGLPVSRCTYRATNGSRGRWPPPLRTPKFSTLTHSCRSCSESNRLRPHEHVKRKRPGVSAGATDMIEAWLDRQPRPECGSATTAIAASDAARTGERTGLTGALAAGVGWNAPILTPQTTDFGPVQQNIVECLLGSLLEQ